MSYMKNKRNYSAKSGGSMRSVRLDDEAEQALEEIRKATGASISDALKQGLLVVREALRQGAAASPYDVYASIDIGPGGYAEVPASEAKAAVRDLIRAKLRR
jgi:hypothetical protein